MIHTIAIEHAQEVPMFSLLSIAIGAGLFAGGGIVGLLVGRKYPGVANAVATVANEAKSGKVDPQAQIDKVVAAVKSAIGQ